MAIQPLIGNPYNGYRNPYYWVDDHPPFYGNNVSLDPSTNEEVLVQLVDGLQAWQGFLGFFRPLCSFSRLRGVVSLQVAIAMQLIQCGSSGSGSGIYTLGPKMLQQLKK